MKIVHPTCVDALKLLKANYLKLPLYKRLWFNLWSYRLASTLSAINFENTTLEQMHTLIRVAKKSWFFKSIFGLLDSFEEILSQFSLQQATPALKFELSKYITPTELSKLSRSSKTYHSLFKPVLDLPKFLHKVTRADYDAVETMLKKDNALLTLRGTVTDKSGRTFTNISGFEYALWALDKHMWTRMLQCLPHDGLGTKLPLLIQQYQGVTRTGITYTNQKGDTISNEKHFDFQGTIIRQLQIQCPASYAPEKFEGLHPTLREGLEFCAHANRTEANWIKGVGNAQKQLPMHVVYEYMSCERSAIRQEDPDRKPDFTKQPTTLHPFHYTLPPEGSTWISHSYPPESQNYWFHPDLGIKFAIGTHYDCTTPNLMPVGMFHITSVWPTTAGWRDHDSVEMDLKDMKALYAVRLKDLNNLGSQLEHAPEDTTESAFRR